MPFRNWHHPPGRYFFLYLSSLFFGDKTFAYRLHSVIFAAGSILIIYLLAKMFLSDRFALLASLFLALDPLHNAFSRLAFEESQLTFFTLLSLYLCFKIAIDKKPALLLPLGIVMGISAATKWGFLPVYLFILCFLSFTFLKEWKNEENSLLVATILTCLVILPLTVYLLSFLPWMKRGYTLIDWLNFQLKMAQSVSSVTITDYGDLIGVSSTAWLWFIRPMFFAYLFQVQNNLIQSVAGFTNPFLWLAFWPATAFLLWVPEVKKIKSLLGAFIVFVLPLLVVSRPVFLYTATPIAAFVSLVIAAAMEVLFKKYKSIVPYLKVYLIIAVVFSLYFYPLEIGLPVNISFYQPILRFYGI